MSLTHLFKQSLTVNRIGVIGHDTYGNETFGVTSTSIVNGYLEQTDSKEVTLNRQTYTSNWLALLPAGTQIDGNDQIVYGGVTYEVIGPPSHVWNPRLGAESHVEARLRVVTG